MAANQQGQRPRARDLGLLSDSTRTGPNNAITDVVGVAVGHSTIIRGSGTHVPGTGPVRTGVTAILPCAGNVFVERVVGGGFVLNGAGELSGLTQVLEWGVIETPIFLTNTLSVGAVSESATRYMLTAYPEIGRAADVILPVVGECDDSWLNDVSGQHVREEHVFEAIEGARGGPVTEGSVGGGTGMICCGFKAGIGTASRVLAEADGGFTLGVLVMTNFGMVEDLRVDGVPIGRVLASRFAGIDTRRSSYGSIIAVAATDAPLQSHQLNRLSKRVALGIGRVGSYAAHTSGEIVIAFSTANVVPRDAPGMIFRIEIMLDRRMDPLYQAAVEATEEAIINALCAAGDMDGIDGRVAPGFPAEDVATVVERIRESLESE
jgi:D-aminopeptidase